jgi:hypothetical protein
VVDLVPAGAWLGVGLAIHGLVALTQNESDWKEHDEGVKWWRERQRHRHEERMAQRAGMRVEVPALREAEQQRMRVAAPIDTGRERAAEAEAAAALEERATRERRRR